MNNDSQVSETLLSYYNTGVVPQMPVIDNANQGDVIKVEYTNELPSKKLAFGESSDVPYRKIEIQLVNNIPTLTVSYKDIKKFVDNGIIPCLSYLGYVWQLTSLSDSDGYVITVASISAGQTLTYIADTEDALLTMVTGGT